MPRFPLPGGVDSRLPFSILAPMQDLTRRPFMELLARRGAPDLYVTEYARVHATSLPERHILDAVDNNRTGRPIVVQLLGEDIPHLIRTIRLLQSHAIAGIDLNLGCPAPKVFRKNVGGGLLRDLPKIERIAMSLRESFDGFFSIKTRIGFADVQSYDALLDILRRAEPDMVTVHGRTVRELYRGTVHYDCIASAVERLAEIPVVANGDITSVEKAQRVLTQTGCAGVMIGRAAVRNPWIFGQIRGFFAGSIILKPTLGDVLEYARDIWAELTGGDAVPESVRLGKMKKLLNFVGQSVDPEGRFLRQMRLTKTAAEFFATCEKYLDGENIGRPFALEPYPGLIARPNCESCEAE